MIGKFSRKKSKRAGFTLLEVMFSVASLAVASLGVLSVLTFGHIAGDSAGTYSEGTQLSREIIENIRVDRFNFDPFNPPNGLVNTDLTQRTDLKAAPFDNPLVSLEDNPRFKRNIQITEIEPDRFARIQVRVYWTSQQGKEKYVETVAFARSGL